MNWPMCPRLTRTTCVDQLRKGRNERERFASVAKPSRVNNRKHSCSQTTFSSSVCIKIFIFSIKKYNFLQKYNFFFCAKKKSYNSCTCNSNVKNSMVYKKINNWEQKRYFIFVYYEIDKILKSM